MLNPKIHITIQGEVGSGKSLLARRLLEDLTDSPFENTYPVIYTEGQYHIEHGTLTEAYVKQAAGRQHIILITITTATNNL